MGVLWGCSAPPRTTESPDAAASSVAVPATPAPLHEELSASVESALISTAKIPEERRTVLGQIAAHIASRRAAGKSTALLFICTHNSRRSQMGQLWSSVAAAHFGIDGVETYSGGTEATAFNPRAVAALRRAGFVIGEPDGPESNPRYTVSIGTDLPTQLAFSKRFGDPPNPQGGFVAIMTCSDADRSCPYVPGADLRVALPYIDPKASDNTSQESRTYDLRSRQIASEMLYLFSRADPVDGSADQTEPGPI